MNKFKEKTIQKITAELWEKHYLKPKFNIIKELLNPLGFRCEEVEFKDSVSGSLIFDHIGNPIICVNLKNSDARKRFSYAHELGHFYLHHETMTVNVEKIFYRNANSSSVEDLREIEANAFAANLLMPQAEIEKNIMENESLEANVEALAKKFLVSEAAMAIRLNNLGYTEA